MIAPRSVSPAPTRTHQTQHLKGDDVMIDRLHLLGSSSKPPPQDIFVQQPHFERKEHHRALVFVDYCAMPRLVCVCDNTDDKMMKLL
jgi:hypothetical protein